MNTLGQSELRMNIKHYFDEVSRGSSYIVPRKGNENVVIISESEYIRLNAYKEKLREITSHMEAQDGGRLSPDEMEALCGDAWSGLYKCLCISGEDDSLVRGDQLSYEERATI